MRLVYILILICASGTIARATPIAPHATIDGRGVTVLAWQQQEAGQVCVYGDVLLFCREYAAGPQRVVLGTRGPLVAHVKSGDMLTLREVGGGSVQVGVVRRWDLWLALIRR